MEKWELRRLFLNIVSSNIVRVSHILKPEFPFFRNESECLSLFAVAHPSSTHTRAHLNARDGQRLGRRANTAHAAVAL